LNERLLAHYWQGLKLDVPHPKSHSPPFIQIIKHILFVQANTHTHTYIHTKFSFFEREMPYCFPQIFADFGRFWQILADFGRFWQILAVFTKKLVLK